MVNFGQFQLLDQYPPPASVTWQAVVYVFQEQLTSSLWEPRWTKRTLSSNFQGGTCALIVNCFFCGSHRGRQHLPLLVHLPPPTEWFPGDLECLCSSSPSHSPIPSFSLFSPFWEPDITDWDVKDNYIGGENC